mmetsp:Transcript_9128/g.22992  ORF Transcript_9128/g.22992 Transcript_9128/m.22992 type:complete len:638 (-) Transcript_9128:271-2184(-)
MAPRRTTAVPLLVMSCFLCAAAARTSSPRRFPLPVFTMAQLTDPSAADEHALRSAVSEVGLFAVSDGAAAAHQALSAFAACALANGDDTAAPHETTGALHTTLGDGTRKTTVAAGTNGTALGPLPDALAAACPGFEAAVSELRSSVARMGRVYARLLDRLLQGAPRLGPVPPGSGDSFVDAVLRAESLEHFHLFQRDEPAAAPDSSTVELHSDMGLFIVMTPAEYVGLSGPEAAAGAGASAGGGLLLELASGEMVAPEVPAGALLVMNGDGMERWMRLGGGAAPHSPGHEVLLPEGGLAGHGRAWFGRMFLPPKDARLPDGSLSFGEYRAAAAAALAAGGAASAAGCSPSRRRVELEEVTPCAAGEVYCWMSCMQVSAGLDCDPATMLCEEAGTGLLWPQDFLDPSSGDPVHCYDCGLTCPAPVPQQPPEPASGRRLDGDPGDFCNAALPATTMWMAGFQTAEPGNGCVAYLFEPWVLSTTAKFALACVGTIAMGMCVEGLVSGRRYLKSRWEPRHPVAKNAAMLALYGAQVTLGYFVMLVAMTYQVELFVCVVLGLMAGHGVFNMRGPVAESADACCQGQDPELHKDGSGAITVCALASTGKGIGGTEHLQLPGACCPGKAPEPAPRSCCAGKGEP